ncbi:hypothetical protein GF362_02470 [Candidatus Dojkabacteria bacterium]|nr:hypothetical protein [Candidatus Dojkabacteria bacterium]
MLVLEIFTTWFWAKKKLIQLNIPIVDRYDRLTQIILHATLPSLTYWSICAFIYSNINSNFWFFLLGIAFILFLMLFVNIRAYYEDKFKLEKRTHVVYDFIKLIVYLFIAYSVFNLRFEYNISKILVSFLLSILSLMIFTFNLLRYKHLVFSNIAYVFMNSILIGLFVFIIMGFKSASIYKLTSLTMIIFYVFTGILHHKIQRDLNKQIVVNYLLIAMLAFAMSIGI